MSDCIVGVMSLDACHQIFSVALSHVRRLIVGVKHLAGYKLRSAEVCFLQCPPDIGFVCPDIVEKCSQDRQLQQCLFDRGILVRCAVKAALRRRIDRSDACEKIRIHILGKYCKRNGIACRHDIRAFSDHIMNKICEKLYIQVIGISQIRLVRAAASQQIYGIYRIVLLKLFHKSAPLIGRRDRI